MAKGMLIVGAGPSPYSIPKPSGLDFEDDEPMAIMVKVAPDGEDRMKIVEIEGEAVESPLVNEKPDRIPYIPEFDED